MERLLDTVRALAQTEAHNSNTSARICEAAGEAPVMDFWDGMRTGYNDVVAVLNEGHATRLELLGAMRHRLANPDLTYVAHGRLGRNVAMKTVLSLISTL